MYHKVEKRDTGKESDGFRQQLLPSTSTDLATSKVLNETTKKVRINVPNQIPKQQQKLTVVQNNMKKKLTPQIMQKYTSHQAGQDKRKTEGAEGPTQAEPELQKYFKSLISSDKLKRRAALFDSFVVVGMQQEDMKAQSFQPKIVDWYPREVFTDGQPTLEHLYVQSLPSVCFMDDLTASNSLPCEAISGSISWDQFWVDRQNSFSKLLHYTITQGTGDKKYMTSLVFKELLVKGR